VKAVTEFYRNPKSSDGLNWWCRQCQSAQARAHSLADPIRKWATDRAGSAKRRAREAGVPYALTSAIVYSLAVPVCPALGIPLSYSGNGVVGPDSPSLDRIVPSLGYVPENVIVVSQRANMIKSNATPEEIQAVGNFYAKLYALLQHNA
jgi:hypothetical protein